MDITLIVFGLAFFLAWITLGPVVDLFDVVMKRRARARWLKAKREGKGLGELGENFPPN